MLGKNVQRTLSKTVMARPRLLEPGLYLGSGSHGHCVASSEVSSGSSRSSSREQVPRGLRRAAGSEMTAAETEASKTGKDGGSREKVREGREPKSIQTSQRAPTATQLAPCYLLTVLQLRHLAVR